MPGQTADGRFSTLHIRLLGPLSGDRHPRGKALASKPEIRLGGVGGHRYAWLTSTGQRGSVERGRPVVRREDDFRPDPAPGSETVSHLGDEYAVRLPLTIDGGPFGRRIIFPSEPPILNESALESVEGPPRALGSDIPDARLCGRVPPVKIQVRQTERRRVPTAVQEAVGGSMPALPLGLKRGTLLIEPGPPSPVELPNDSLEGIGPATQRLCNLSATLRPPMSRASAFLHAAGYRHREGSAREAVAIRGDRTFATNEES